MQNRPAYRDSIKTSTAAHRSSPVRGRSVITLAAAGTLQPVQLIFPRQGLLQLAPAGQRRQQWIVTQLLMIVDVQRQPVDPRAEHLGELVGDQQRRPPVGDPSATYA